MTDISQLVEVSATPRYKQHGMLTGLQLYLARHALRWTVDRVAKEAKLSHSTIARAEATNGIPPLRAEHLFAIQKVFESEGVVFLDEHETSVDGGVGVRLRG